MPEAEVQTKPKVTSADRFSITIKEDGSIASSRMELFAILIADGFEPREVWPNLKDTKGNLGENHSTSVRVRNLALSNKDFQTRVSNLKEERRQTIGSHPLFGEALWQATTIYRMASVKQDVVNMSKALAQRLEILKMINEKAPNLDPPAPAEPKASPGRPAVKNPSTTRHPSAMKRELLEMGLKNAPKSLVEGVILENGA